MKLIEGNSAFLESFKEDERNHTWVKVRLSDDKLYHFRLGKLWTHIKSICEKRSLSVETIELQFKSHVENIYSRSQDAEAVYLVRTVMGQMGAASREYYTLGELKDGIVHKSMWLIPEIMVDKTYEDELENCFEEAMIYNHDKGKIRKE
jgi:hypothetical protein